MKKNEMSRLQRVCDTLGARAHTHTHTHRERERERERVESQKRRHVRRVGVIEHASDLLLGQLDGEAFVHEAPRL
jgi:hypothetical protein